MLFEPGISEDHALFSKTSYCENDPLGVSVVGHKHIHDFVDASGFVRCSVYIEDGDGFRKLSSRELACGYEVAVYEFACRTRVDHGLCRRLFQSVCGFQMDWDHNAFGVHYKGADH